MIFGKKIPSNPVKRIEYICKTLNFESRVQFEAVSLYMDYIYYYKIMNKNFDKGLVAACIIMVSTTKFIYIPFEKYEKIFKVSINYIIKGQNQLNYFLKNIPAVDLDNFI